MKNSTLISAAAAGIIAAGMSLQAQEVRAQTSDKCYGIAKTSQNNCASATGVHSCKGKAEMDDDPGDFVYLAPVDCQKYGGNVVPPPSPASQSDQ